MKRTLEIFFLVMSGLEKQKAWEIAQSIRRDKNLKRVLSEERWH